MAVDVWGGMNQGLASLNNTFDDLARQRQVDEQQARQTRIDALQEPILKAQGETANLNAEEARRKITDLRAYDAARKQLEANPGTIPTVAAQPNPDYKPPVSGVVDPVSQAQGLSGSGAIDPTDIYTKPAEGLPTMNVAGTRPLTSQEMDQQRLKLAVAHGQWDQVKNIAEISDATQKLGTRDAAILTQWGTAVSAFAKTNGPQAAKAYGELLARQLDPSGQLAQHVQGFDFSGGGMQKSIKGPNGEYLGEAILDETGRLHVVQPKEQNKTQSEEQLTAKALAGDKQAQAVLDAMQARKLSIAKQQKAITINGLSDAENQALNNAISDGRLDPNRVNSRTVKIYAQQEMLNPGGVSFAGASADIQSNRDALVKNAQRETATRTFVNRIESNTNTIKDIRSRYGTNFGKLLNSAVNNARQGITGSGDLGALQLALVSTSNEVAKVESGSLGMQEVSVQQAQAMRKIFTENYDESDLLKVLDTAHGLGQNSIDAIQKESARLKGNLKGKAKNTPSPASPSATHRFNPATGLVEEVK